jgi:hypothetical protein
MLKMREKAPFGVLFCGIPQIFTLPGIDSLGWLWYLTRLIISMREINHLRKPSR